MKAKDTLLLNNTITQNPILVRRAWFWHVASHIICLYFRTKALVLELLAAVCLVQGGHDLILAAFDHFKEVFFIRFTS